MLSIRSLAVFVSLIAGVLGQARINTPPSLVECQPAQISWSGGEAPYYLTILPGGQTGGTPLEQFPETEDTSMTWTVDIAADTSITFEIRDGSGAVNYSSQVTIQSGTNESCLSAGSSAAGSSTASASSTESASSGSSTASSEASTSTSSSEASSAESSEASTSSEESSSATSDAAQESASDDEDGSALSVYPFSGFAAGLSTAALAFFFAA